MEAFLQGESVKSVGVAAMLLALTRTLKDEETAKRALTEVGHKFEFVARSEDRGRRKNVL